MIQTTTKHCPLIRRPVTLLLTVSGIVTAKSGGRMSGSSLSGAREPQVKAIS